jgi:FtsP/CotA-like multicopper oxidase with cupredoxin domain
VRIRHRRRVGVAARVQGSLASTPPHHLDGWKDTVYVPPGETVRFLVHFDDYADPDTP